MDYEKNIGRKCELQDDSAVLCTTKRGRWLVKIYHGVFYKYTRLNKKENNAFLWSVWMIRYETK